MTRVSENSSTSSLQFALNKTKQKMEDLQLKGSTLKSMTRPSDNPVSNVEALAITSSTNDNEQFIKNADYALMFLNTSEKSIEELTDIMTKAKEIAIAQASDFFNADVRKNVANEVQQLYNQALSIANKKVGLKYIFGGYKTLQPPFDGKGNYAGDTGHVTIEVSKNFFVPITLNGDEVFFSDEDEFNYVEHPLEKFDNFEKSPISAGGMRNPATSSESGPSENFKSRDNLFAQLNALTTALENNDPELIQGLLDKFDNSISRLITLRTRIGSIENSVNSSRKTSESENIDHATRKSNLVDADVAQLFADIQKQQSILKTTYQSSHGVMNQNLMDFLRR